MRRLLPAFLLVVAISANPLHGDDAQKDLDKFQGTWNVLGMVANGKVVEKIDPTRFTVTFKADKMTMKAPGYNVEWTVKIDPSKTPKSLDATSLSGEHKGKTYLAIYKFEKQFGNDELRIVLPKLPNKDRPKEFKAPRKSELSLLILQKLEK